VPNFFGKSAPKRASEDPERQQSSKERQRLETFEKTKARR
jgi:hypothetical protein